VSILDETQFVERLEFFNGQLLTASDLQGIDDFNRQMRWLHNASLHQPGIGSGFAVTGKKGDPQVTIKPGYALDDLGREIVLTHDSIEPIPPVAGDGAGGPAWYSLTVSYPDDAALDPTETREVICNPGQSGVVRRREVPVFCWVAITSDTGLPVDANAKADILAHRKIVLAEIAVLNCQLKQAVTVARRCNARPDCGAHVCCGRVRFSELKMLPEPRLAAALRLITFEPFKISTADAAFLSVPQYSVQIQGNRLLKISLRETAARILVFDQLRIEEQTQDSITVRLVVLPLFERLQPRERTARAKQMDPVGAAIERQWKIAWMGVEP
jgi:hypothetical protein